MSERKKRKIYEVLTHKKNRENIRGVGFFRDNLLPALVLLVLFDQTRLRKRSNNATTRECHTCTRMTEPTHLMPNFWPIIQVC